MENFRTTKRLGIAAYGSLLLLAAWFWQERTLFSDIAFQTFLMLQDGGLQIMVSRWIAAVTHLWPWLASKAGLPLPTVLMSFSLGFALWYAFAFFACLWLRQWRLALAMLFFSTLLVKDTFFWVTSELAQGGALLFLVFAWLLSWSDLTLPSPVFSKKWFLGLGKWALLAGLMATLVYAHPMLAFPVTFAALFLAWDARKMPGKSLQLLAALAVFACFWVLKNKILPLNWYDAMSQERAAKLWQIFPNWFDLQANRDFLRWCLHDWPFLLPAFLAVGIFYLWKKEWVKLTLSLGFSTLYTLLVNVSFAEGDQQFYLESLYLPLSVFVGLPLVWDVLPFEKKPRRAFFIVGLVAVSGIARILMASPDWTARLGWQKSVLEKTASAPARKLVLHENQVPMPLLRFSWGTSYEFLLLSALAHPDSARCLIVDENPERFKDVLREQKMFLGEFKNFRFEDLPQRWIRPADTSAYELNTLIFK